MDLAEEDRVVAEPRDPLLSFASVGSSTQVERGYIDEGDFRAFTCDHALALWAPVRARFS